MLLPLALCLAISNPTPAPTINPALVKLEKKYNATRNAACAKAASQAPTLNAADAAAFMTAYQGFFGNNSETPVLAAAKKLMTPALDTFLSLPDSINAGGLDAALVTCALMTDAVRGEKVGRTEEKDLLAAFAVLGATEEALVDKLISDPLLMRGMLVAGGVIGGHYGQAMGVWTNLTKASSYLRAVILDESAATPWDSRDPATMLQRLAIGVAVGLADPLEHRNGSSYVGSKYVDPVARYLNFEKSFKAGDLDPAFPILTAFELAHTVNVKALEEDLVWLRATLMSYRPEDIAIDYHWRYAESVHTDVMYGDSTCDKFNNGTGGVCDGTYKDIPVGGDVCGGRAFWGRFACKGFGRPTWGATQHGHAAMSAWTPTGWTVLLGAPWPDSYWGDRGGEDFVLETQARANAAAWQKILRGGWIALAKNEVPVGMDWHEQCSKTVLDPQCNSNGIGGLWSALMLYMKKSVRDTSPPMNVTSLIPTGASALNNKIDQLLAAVAKNNADPSPPAPITTGTDGIITVPAPTFSSKNKSAPVSAMVSAGGGMQMLSSGCTSTVGPPCFHPSSSSVTYIVPSSKAGTFYLTANFSTYHMNQDLYVTVNDAPPAHKSPKLLVPMFYTQGWWNETQPIKVALVEGNNTLVFTRTTGRDVMFKEFFLSPKMPVVPKPNGNWTPTPAPAQNASDYIEVAASTTCVEQGIKPVTEDDCGHACLALGFKDTGPRARANISGCFVMTSGPYAGNCNFNTNKSAVCKPPCTLMGVVVRSLCTRV